MGYMFKVGMSGGAWALAGRLVETPLDKYGVSAWQFVRLVARDP